jgi:hypothetical protein
MVSIGIPATESALISVRVVVACLSSFLHENKIRLSVASSKIVFFILK